MIRCSIDEILTLTGGDPVVRGVGGARRGPAWRSTDGATVAFSGLDAEERVRVVVALGPPDQAADLVLAIRSELPDGSRLIVPRATPLSLAGSSDWNFRAAYQAPPLQPAEDSVTWTEDDEAITELLKLTSPGSSAWPGHDKVRRWAGIHDDGGLVACLADTTSIMGTGHISAIAVHPRARGRALGPSITAWAMRRLFDQGCDVITLGVYADNAVGMRIYDRLGFTVDRALTSGVLTEAGRPAWL